VIHLPKENVSSLLLALSQKKVPETIHITTCKIGGPALKGDVGSKATCCIAQHGGFRGVKTRKGVPLSDKAIISLPREPGGEVHVGVMAVTFPGIS
jgi:hypothetical protein